MPALGIAQDYPSKPLRIVVGYPPGGANDIIARVVAQKLSEAWGQQAIVDNRPGAIGVIGTEMVARSAPDGHTMGVVSLSPLVFSRFAHAKLPYDSLTDFTPLATLASALNFCVGCEMYMLLARLREATAAVVPYLA